MKKFLLFISLFFFAGMLHAQNSSSINFIPDSSIINKVTIEPAKGNAYKITVHRGADSEVHFASRPPAGTYAVMQNNPEQGTYLEKIIHNRQAGYFLWNVASDMSAIRSPITAEQVKMVLSPLPESDDDK